MPPISPGKEVILEISFDNSVLPVYQDVKLTHFCLGSNQQNLEQNCEIDPIISYYPIKAGEFLRLQIPEGIYSYGKIIFWSNGGIGAKAATAVAYFTRNFDKSSDQNGCFPKGVSLEGSLSRLKYNCKMLMFRSGEKHRIIFRILDDSYSDGISIYTALSTFPIGGDLRAAQIIYTVSRMKP